MFILHFFGLHDLLSIDYFQGKNIFFAVKDLLSIDYIKIIYQLAIISYVDLLSVD